MVCIGCAESVVLARVQPGVPCNPHLLLGAAVLRLMSAGCCAGAWGCARVLSSACHS